ncbi:MAG: hypothetical protein AB1499_05065 [Nitrospirota bacterium]
MNNRKIIIVVLVSVMLFASVGIATGFFDKVVTACKAFIYCNGAPIDTQKQVR